ncbi:MAG: alkane 1-monooxygenase [Bacteroidetes bacterium]|nr:MAG: alkane 1-monooxygenase [Bacteroidota bacterium]PTM14912.1 MAG: alkane 1-monooxygenase [Bacteroidota bacterium]
MKSFKYLTAYIIPALAVWGLLQGGWASFATVGFAFGIVPVLEMLLPQSTKNLPADQQQDLLGERIFDWLLYLNVPIVYSIVGLYIYQLNTQVYTTGEWVGQLLAVGIVLGSCGINVGHELGHRTRPFERFLSKALLLPCLYQHFFIEHNRGHHKNVATPLDPATARRGEILYTFWFRSLWGSYRSAWRIERDTLRQQGLPWLSFHNEMIRFSMQQAIYIGLVFLLTPDWQSALAVLLAGLVGVLLLESINYVEHYGLQRQLLPNGRYERVMPHHSWNANYQLGRIMLYELTRHSDHHYLANKKYQVLEHHEAAPVLPLGYPGCILLAMVPPLWFYVMDRELAKVSGVNG